MGNDTHLSISDRRRFYILLEMGIVGLIKGVDIGICKVPGTKIGNGLGETIYTPPEGEHIIREKLANLEKFAHAEDGIDPLIKLAIMHYQFEAIHPFVDLCMH